LTFYYIYIRCNEEEDEANGAGGLDDDGNALSENDPSGLQSIFVVG
jgi:hypothetical protein